MFDCPVCVQCCLWTVTFGTIHTEHQFLIGGVLADMHMSPQYPKKLILLVHFTCSVTDLEFYCADADPDLAQNTDYCYFFSDIGNCYSLLVTNDPDAQ
jgi:hypothetical protein